MQNLRSALTYGFAVVLIVGAYYVGSFAGGLLTTDAHAMPAPRPVPIAAEIAENVA